MGTFHKGFLNCKSFAFEEKFSKCILDELNKKDPKDTCILKHVVEPFKKITDHLTQ